MQGTYETFAEMGRQHYGGDLKGKWILTAGLGGMGGAQPLAAVMAGAHCIAIEVPGKPHREAARDALPRPSRDQHRRGARDHRARRPSRPPSACSAMPPRSCPKWSRAASAPTRSPTRPAPTIRPTAIARSAGASPNGSRCASATPPRSPPPRASRWRVHVEAMLAFQEMGVPTFDYGNNIRQEALDEGRHPRLRFPRLRPRLCPARSSAAASARSAGSRCRGDPEDIYRTDAAG